MEEDESEQKENTRFHCDCTRVQNANIELKCYVVHVIPASFLMHVYCVYGTSGTHLGAADDGLYTLYGVRARARALTASALSSLPFAFCLSSDKVFRGRTTEPVAGYRIKRGRTRRVLIYDIFPTRTVAVVASPPHSRLRRTPSHRCP